jgi:hypothetical protein
MTGWTKNELAKIGKAEELEIASFRRNGTLRDPVTIWVVRHGDDLYVRSVNGRAGVWYRGTRASHRGHIQAGGVDKDVALVEAEADVNDEVDAQYRKKYRRYAPSIVNSVLTTKARSATIRLEPRSKSS